MQEIHHPVAAYRTELRDAHARNTAACFESLVQRSGVDEAANAQTIAALTAAEAACKEAGNTGSMLLVAGVVVGIAGLCGAVATFASAVWWACVPLASVWAIVQQITPRYREAAANEQALQAECDALKATARVQLAPLNALYDWDIPARLIQQTLPLLELEPYFTFGHLQDLRHTYDWDDRIHTDDRSILFTLPGTLGGHPFVVGQSLLHAMSLQIYWGSLVISWEERYRDSQGQVQTRTHTQTLTATVTKPAPMYQRQSFVLYGHEAAPDLSFSREPSSLSSASDGMLGRWRKGLAVQQLQAKARQLEGFTVMSNQEFDALFHATNRDHEVQFRVLFTPLAQQEMLQVLKDQEAGFGDDFSFYKWRKVTAVLPAQLSRIDIGLPPGSFHHHDLSAARQRFADYHNGLFRSLYFSLAPLLAIPIYQQRRTQPVQHRDAQALRPSFWEVEALANAMGQSTFAHPASATTNILRVACTYVEDGVEEAEVTAYGYRAKDRVDYVEVQGGDGHWHEVPVPWTEYIPVERTTSLLVFVWKGPLAEAEGQEPVWRERMRAHGVEPEEATFHRALAGVVLG